MKTTKFFFMAALALMTAACSNSDNDILTPAEQPAKAGGITITAQLAPKSSVSGTRAVEDKSTYIESKWAVDEHLAILYTKEGKQMADARIKSVDASGNATIEFTVVDGTADNTYCEIIYPYSAARTDKSGRKSNSALLSNQDGTLSANLDVRYGDGKIQVTTLGLDVTTQPQAQFAIWKLTTPSAKNLCIMANGVLIAGATLASAGTEFTVAVPQFVNQTIAVVANDESNNCYYYSKADVSLDAGKYYQSSPTMETLDTDDNKDVYKMTGAGTIPAGKTVVLSGVTISGDQIACSGNANIILMGDNTVSAALNQAAIKIGGSGTTLTITSSGSLTAQGGFGGAGIGTDIVTSGTLSVGNIVINGGTVTATGGNSGAGIGTGQAQNATNTCGDITINGGTVIAQGGGDAAGIGTGLSFQDAGTASNRCGNITIGTGVISVTAKKSSSTPGPNSIGKGTAADGGTQACGTITIGGDATTYAAGVTTSPFTYPAP